LPNGKFWKLPIGVGLERKQVVQKQTKYKPGSNCPLILLNHVIQVLVGPDERLSGQYAFGLQFGYGLMRRPTARELGHAGDYP
jgi:hypothetical protein